MRILLIVMFIIQSHGGQYHDGIAKWYSEGVMEQVARNRGMPIQDCMTSSPRYPIGTWVLITGQETGVSEECIVTDVSHPRDRARHLREGTEAELSYQAAKRICGETRNGRPKNCRVRVRLL